ALEAEPTLIKPNLRELEEIWEQKLSFREAISVSQELIDSGIEIVVISLGAEGALLVGDEEVWYAKAPQVEVVSTVGAGDSMVGALAVAYTRGYSLKRMLQFAVAMSIATILLAGSELGSLEEVERWMEKVEVRQVEG
ncbi:MAG: PfkB family carbohydrate kinase, partial [Halanaerobacter sp.]